MNKNLRNLIEHAVFLLFIIESHVVTLYCWGTLDYKWSWFLGVYITPLVLLWFVFQTKREEEKEKRISNFPHWRKRVSE